MPKAVRLYYWNGMPNFGDQLNLNICDTLFATKVVHAEPESCEASFVGSLLDDFLYPKNSMFAPFCLLKRFIRPPVQVWGTGFMYEKGGFTPKRAPELPELFFRRANINAVRGILSKKRLEKILKKSLNNAVVADPGLLADRLIEKTAVAKKYRLGIIPNHIEKGMDVFKKIQIPNATIIDMEAEPLDCIKKIAQCEFVLSSALHGLIVADSFGIPNLRMIASNRIFGGNYKFNDYYSSHGMETHDVFDLRVKEFLPADFGLIEKNYRINPHSVEIMKNRLIACFPYRNA